ncbi:hypothetical protein EUX98_g8896 [Antrodiella citrinella]|uniref:HAT C-terminal dimerisation domain-containing protein n=1 Tax=Antrodiella citrinella TaxID=2447956 RepID=A0A4S4M352_9APHY|nr:hypothetical protein EUX98_g8896 [Antrodiella citrinella]
MADLPPPSSTSNGPPTLPVKRSGRVGKPAQRLVDPNNSADIELTQHQRQRDDAAKRSRIPPSLQPVTLAADSPLQHSSVTGPIPAAHGSTSTLTVPPHHPRTSNNSPAHVGADPAQPRSNVIDVSDDDDEEGKGDNEGDNEGDEGEDDDLPRGEKRPRPPSTSPSAIISDEDDDSDDDAAAEASRRKRARAASRSALRDELGDDGLLKDIDVPAINEEFAQPKYDKTADIKYFFDKPVARKAASGATRMHRMCKVCKPGNYLIAEVTTLRRHCEAKHKPLYDAWAKENQFKSMLPKHTKLAKEVAKAIENDRLQQTTLDGNLRPLPEREHIQKYTDRAFREAAIAWLIETDQPLSALDHPKFKAMIELAARSTDGVTIPTRQAAREEILRIFHREMGNLRTQFASDNCKGEISLTCDAWQAGNVDAYFAVTAHWIDESKPLNWEMQNAIIGFTRLNSAHNGVRLGQALYKIVDRIGVAHKVGHITCDNASNNKTMLREFAKHIFTKTGKAYDVKSRQVNCIAHVINLATQALIAAYSKSPHFDPADPLSHKPDRHAAQRDEIGLIRAIVVKERSSSKRKEIFRTVQTRAGVERPLQLLLDMKVRWSSTFIMLVRAIETRDHVDRFVYEIGLEETDNRKRRAIDDLQLSTQEWSRAAEFVKLLAHADRAQQSFSYENVSTMHQALPALEALHKAWSSRALRPQYAAFKPALDAASEKVAEYYDKTVYSLAHTDLVPDEKGAHFKKHWDSDLRGRALAVMEQIFKDRYKSMYGNEAAPPLPTKRKSKIRTLVSELSDDSDDEHIEAPSTASTSSVNALLGDPSKPWLGEFHRYLNTSEALPEELSTVKWWGLNQSRYPVWASIARDYLPIMATSVSSERAFSQGGITVSKLRNRLKGDIVEALQCLKCLIQRDLLFRSAGPSSATELAATSETVTTGDEDVEVGATKAGGTDTWDLMLDENDDIYDYGDDDNMSFM